MAAKDQAN